MSTSSKFPGDTAAGGPGTTLREPLDLDMGISKGSVLERSKTTVGTWSVEQSDGGTRAGVHRDRLRWEVQAWVRG